MGKKQSDLLARKKMNYEFPILILLMHACTDINKLQQDS